MRKLGESVHRLVASPEFVARLGQPQNPADLSFWPSIDYGPPRPDHIWTVHNPQGMNASVRHHPRLVTDDVKMLHDGAIQGLGVALLPTVVVARELETGRLVDLLPEWRPKRWVVYAVFPSRRGLLPSVRMLIDYIADGCATTTL